LSHGDSRIEAVESYWDRHVDDWKIASHKPGTPGFFRETEQYRFEKLHYLNDRVPFGEWDGSDILEVGCGLGNDLSRFAVAGARVTGIDISSRAIELSRANFEQRSLSGTFTQMNGEDLQFEDDSFDFCYCHTVLQFTPDPGAMVAEIHRVLKPGGQAIIMALNRRSWLMFLQRVMKTEIDYMDAPEYHLFGVTDLRQVMEPFSELSIVMERFPVRTKIHSGLKARVYNSLFVDFFNALPARITQSFGHHMLAFVRK
jgi:ubiquinone/menaquinone biosynthesis C-methylase UbiE